MTRQRALAEADAELSRCVQEGFGLFLIAELYGVPVRRLANDTQAELDANYQALPEYLKGSPGVLTWEYVRQAIADQVEAILEKEKADQPAVYKQLQVSLPGLRQAAFGHGWNLGFVGERRRRLSQREVHKGDGRLVQGERRCQESGPRLSAKHRAADRQRIGQR